MASKIGFDLYTRSTCTRVYTVVEIKNQELTTTYTYVYINLKKPNIMYESNPRVPIPPGKPRAFDMSQVPDRREFDTCSGPNPPGI